MPSKGKPKHEALPGPAATAVVEEALAGGPAAAGADPGSVEGVSSTTSAPAAQQLLPKAALPTHLEPAFGPLPEQHMPEEAVGTLNALVAEQVLTKEEFSSIYLHELAPLGATQEGGPDAANLTTPVAGDTPDRSACGTVGSASDRRLIDRAGDGQTLVYGVRGVDLFGPPPRPRPHSSGP